MKKSFIKRRRRVVPATPGQDFRPPQAPQSSSAAGQQDTPQPGARQQQVQYSQDGYPAPIPVDFTSYQQRQNEDSPGMISLKRGRENNEPDAGRGQAVPAESSNYYARQEDGRVGEGHGAGEWYETEDRPAQKRRKGMLRASREARREQLVEAMKIIQSELEELDRDEHAEEEGDEEGSGGGHVNRNQTGNCDVVSAAEIRAEASNELGRDGTNGAPEKADDAG